MRAYHITMAHPAAYKEHHQPENQELIQVALDTPEFKIIQRILSDYKFTFMDELARQGKLTTDKLVRPHFSIVMLPPYDEYPHYRIRLLFSTIHNIWKDEYAFSEKEFNDKTARESILVQSMQRFLMYLMRTLYGVRHPEEERKMWLTGTCDHTESGQYVEGSDKMILCIREGIHGSVHKYECVPYKP